MNEEALLVLAQLSEMMAQAAEILIVLRADVKRLKEEREADMRANRLAVSLGELFDRG